MTPTHALTQEDRFTLEHLNIPNNDITALKRFFAINRDDEKRLASLKDLASEYGEGLVDAYYEHAMAHPETAKYFSDPRALDRARDEQTTYFQQLTDGRYETAYIESRLEIGQTQNRMNLPPKWYIGGLSYYLDCVALELNKHHEEDPQKALDSYRALVKLMLLDIAIVMESSLTQRQRQLEKADQVKAVQEFMNGMLNAAQNVAIYSISPEGKVTSWNTGAEKIFGFSESEAIGMDFRRFYPKEDLDSGVPDREIREASNRGSITLEGWRLSKTKRFYAQASLSPLYDSTGRVVSLVKVVLDNTERRHLQERMEGILNAAANAAIYTITPEGHITSWNTGSEKIFGYSENEAIGMDFRRFYPKEDLDKGVPDWEIREASSSGSINLEGWRLAKGDKRFYAQASLSRLFDASGKVNALVKIVLDNTERKQVEIKLADQRKEMDSLIKLLNGTTSQVTAVAAQLSASTTETTAAIAETTATAEQVKQTADHTSQKAKSVSEDARAVVQISRQGQEATGATVKGMVRIREQMESIADCMAQLSNQSKLIGDIIATVDDLAQQSNLLAVNASIEAAKAGEQGKGFAVVAQEVKNLSQQSKSATAHIRSILNDIVNATTAATLATEQGSKFVEIGHEQASEAGYVIRTLSESIEKAALAAEVIEVSSQQQLIGMKQMVEAMAAIKIASEQNLASVGQLDMSGRELSDLGHRLGYLSGE